MPGPPGPPGQMGPHGINGAPGAAGAMGPHGLPGISGPQGVAGAPGIPGQPGPAGLNGLPGTAGTPGVGGAPGANGAGGVPGSHGAPGAPGQAGAPGSQGSPGSVITFTLISPLIPPSILSECPFVSVPLGILYLVLGLFERFYQKSRAGLKELVSLYRSLLCARTARYYVCTARYYACALLHFYASPCEHVHSYVSNGAMPVQAGAPGTPGAHGQGYGYYGRRRRRH